MKQIIKKLPIPIAGLMLGLASLGNLLQSYGEIYRSVFGIIAGIIFILLLVKITMNFNGVKEALENPVVASVFPTYSMGIMLLSTYLKQINSALALCIWYIGVVLHLVLMLWFTIKFVAKFNIKQVFPSWYIPFVGIVVASVTAPVYKMQVLGQIAFWFGFVTFIALFIVIIYRVIKVKGIPEAAQPTLIIFAAPASLLLAGYLNSFTEKSISLVYILGIISLITYLIVLAILLFKLIKIKFYPSYSAFTFPLVISAMAMKLTNGFLTKSGQAIGGMKYLVQAQELIAVVFVIYVLIRYINFLFKNEAAKASEANLSK